MYTYNESIENDNPSNDFFKTIGHTTYVYKCMVLLFTTMICVMHNRIKRRTKAAL